MSRIGKLPIPVPSGVEVSINGRDITVKGPRGELSHTRTARCWSGDRTTSATARPGTG